MSFLAVRPILTGEMITAKYRMTARCVLHIWFLVLVMTGSWLLLKGYAGDMAELSRFFFGAYPGWRGRAILALAIVLVPVFTWKLLTDSLVPVLTGRRWLADGTVLGNFSLLICLIAAGLWCASHPEGLVQIIPPLTWLASVWVIIKALLPSGLSPGPAPGTAPRRVGPRHLCVLARAGCRHNDPGLPALAPGRAAGPEGVALVASLSVCPWPASPWRPWRWTGTGIAERLAMTARQQGLDSSPIHLYVADGGMPPGGENEIEIRESTGARR